MFTWVHALATILIINEKAFSGGLKVSEQLRMWQDRLRILAKPPWILAPLHLAVTEKGTTWAEAMTARPVMGTDGTLTIALGEGENYRVLLLLTGFFGVIGSLFKGIWDRRCRKRSNLMTTSRSSPLPSRPYMINPAAHVDWSTA